MGAILSRRLPNVQKAASGRGLVSLTRPLTVVNRAPSTRSVVYDAAAPDGRSKTQGSSMPTNRFFLAAAAVAALASAPFAAQAQDAAPAASAAKPVTVQGDLVDTLKLNGGFTTFVGGLDATNLSGLLKTNKNLTVFAPSDAAFATLPAADLDKLKADKAAMQKFLLHHIVNAPVDSTKIKGAKGPVPSGAGDTILLDGSDEGGKLKVDGATIVQADLHTGSGLLHVVDKPLVAGQGDTAPAAPAADASATTNN
ncbi:MAG: hypothetical protein DI570_06820 [Phenylobacterium zucineum]|nr:MAG: hypothetical protein DI570_06820 [Phenylobacterium zucineum]